MEMELKEVEGVAVIHIQGELDALSAPDLTRFFAAFCQR